MTFFAIQIGLLLSENLLQMSAPKSEKKTSGPFATRSKSLFPKFPAFLKEEAGHRLLKKKNARTYGFCQKGREFDFLTVEFDHFAGKTKEQTQLTTKYSLLGQRET